MQHAALVVFLMVPSLWSQEQVTWSATAPPAPSSVGAAANGVRGGTTLYYWVIARYPGGASSATMAMAFSTVGGGNLSVSNFVRVSWAPVAGATGYDVLRSDTPAFPGPSCAACAVVLNTASTSVDDTGGALSAYPPGGLNSAVPVTASLTINNRDANLPYVNLQLLSIRLNEVLRVGLISGTPADNDCLKYFAGRIVSAGAGCGSGGGGSGDVTAAANFATNESVIVADGTGKGVKSSTCSVTTGALSCPGAISSGSGSPDPGEQRLFEASPGTNYVSWHAPAVLGAITRYRMPSTPPSSQMKLECGVPSGSPPVSQCTFVSGGGGVKRSVYASIPGTCDASVADTEWIIDDGITSVHCNGSAFQHYYRRLKITPPGPQSAWTLVNAPSEVTDIPGGVIYMRDAFHDNAGLKGVVKPMTVGSDWVVQGSVITEGQGYNFNACGIGIANGNTTAARVLWVGLQHVDASGGSVFVIGYDYTNYTTLGSGNVFGSVAPVTSSDTKSVRITKTGANWTISLSSNGTKFTDIVTEATRFTPTHFGMFCDSRGDGSAPGGFAAGTFISISAQ